MKMKMKMKKMNPCIIIKLRCAIVYPNKKTVLPFAPKPIMSQDGEEKNDCERVVAKRLFYRLKDEHPGLLFCILGDSLFATAPNFQLIQSHRWEGILEVKPRPYKTLS